MLRSIALQRVVLGGDVGQRRIEDAGSHPLVGRRGARKLLVDGLLSCVHAGEWPIGAQTGQFVDVRRLLRRLMIALVAKRQQRWRELLSRPNSDMEDGNASGNGGSLFVESGRPNALRALQLEGLGRDDGHL